MRLSQRASGGDTPRQRRRLADEDRPHTDWEAGAGRSGTTMGCPCPRACARPGHHAGRTLQGILAPACQWPIQSGQTGTAAPRHRVSRRRPENSACLWPHGSAGDNPIFLQDRAAGDRRGWPLMAGDAAVQARRTTGLSPPHTGLGLDGVGSRPPSDSGSEGLRLPMTETRTGREVLLRAVPHYVVAGWALPKRVASSVTTATAPAARIIAR